MAVILELRDFGKFHRHFIFINTCFSFSVGLFSFSVWTSCLPHSRVKTSSRIGILKMWLANTISTKKWSATHKRWIDVMDQLFTTFMGKDFLAYRYTEDVAGRTL